ncbi:MAG: histidine kinase, partial [Verrucomicrobiaceae bacterium]
SGNPAATAPIRLAQESGSQRGFIVFCPLYRKSVSFPEERRAALTGFATAVFRIGDLVELSLRSMNGHGVALTIRDEGTGETIYHQEAARLSGHPPWHSTLEVAGRRWSLLFEPTTAFPSPHGGLLPWIVPAAGLIITGLLTSYLRSSARQAARLQRSHAALSREVAVRQRAETAADSASRAKSEFLASMSHEIRTPLHAILGYSQILARDETLPPFHRDAVATILGSGRHLLRLIDEILDLSKIDAGRMEIAAGDFDLAALLRDLAGMVQPSCEEKNLGLLCEAPARPAVLHGDEGKLRQVLLNLLANAVKFTQHGRILLSASPVGGGGDSWEFQVVDTGIGIPDEVQAKIFDPFQQGPGSRRHGGTGLGLAIARRQVELMGGHLTVESTPGAGARFAFTLPLPSAAG